MTLKHPICTALFCLGSVLTAISGRAQERDEAEPIDITLQRAIEMALENNLDIVVSRLDTQVQSEGAASARGVYQPLLSANINNLDSRSPAQSQLVGAQVLTSTRTNYNFIWQHELSTGGRYNVSWQNLRSTTNSAFSGFNPLYDAAVSGQVIQPLMQNFRLDPNKQRILVAQNSERISRHQFQVQVMDTVSNVEFAYWDLVFAFRDLEVARKSLELAQDLLRNNRIQVEVGTMAPIDVLEAEAEVAAREEAVILAEEAIRLTEDILKRLINDPESADFWANSYHPVDQPRSDEVAIDIDEAVRTALQRRPVLEQSRVELETRDYNVRYTRNQMLPQVDLVGSMAFNGIGGTQLVREDFALPPSLVIPGGYGDAVDQIFGGDFRDWSVGLSVSYPLGNSQAAAAHAQAQVAARQQRARIESDELFIAQEVRQAARAVDTNRKRIDATRVARELAVRRLEAEQKKFEVGMSTSFFIVQSQRDLSQAAANELRALIDYNKAIAAFERARGTILDRSNISVR
ncbi:MAG TPA: TolC family protein [Vicinamibacteria bacterium]|nr:TolC family protein [Vicinamibacteria bacterium]